MTVLTIETDKHQILISLHANMFVDSSAILQTSREDISRYFDRQKISHRMLSRKGFMYVRMHLYLCQFTNTYHVEFDAITLEYIIFSSNKMYVGFWSFVANQPALLMVCLIPEFFLVLFISRHLFSNTSIQIALGWIMLNHRRKKSNRHHSWFCFDSLAFTAMTFLPFSFRFCRLLYLDDSNLA